jgi:hypothetical protein
MLDNLRFVFFTNENNISLIELTLKYFFKHNNLENIKVSVISNNYKDYSTLPFKDKVEYLNGNVSFKSDGSHFSESLKNTLCDIKEDYIFFFCDDYFFVDDTKFEDLNKLMDLITKEDIDYFGLDSINGCRSRIKEPSWKSFHSPHSQFPDDFFYTMDFNYQYLYSVQPCIWKKSSLNKLANNYHFSLHNLDNTLPHIKQNDFKCIALSDTFSFSDYFIIAYIEVLRHGCFIHPLNGFHYSSDHPTVKFINKVIQEENLLNNLNFKSQIFKIRIGDE